MKSVVSAKETCYRALRQLILEGHFRPGDRLVIRELAERFGVSAQPVREALNRLASERAVVAVHNRSMHIPMLSEPEIDELWLLRETLEPLVGRHAVRHVTPDLVARLRVLSEERRAARMALSFHAVVRLNVEFHFALYAAARLPTSEMLIHGLWLQAGPLLRQLMEAETTHPAGDVLHERIVAGLMAQDEDAVAEALLEDVAEARPRIAAVRAETRRPRSSGRADRSARSAAPRL